MPLVRPCKQDLLVANRRLTASKIRPMVPFTASQIQEFRGCTGRGGDSNEDQRLNMQAAVCRAIHGGPSTPPHSQKLSLGGRFNSSGPATRQSKKQHKNSAVFL